MASLLDALASLPPEQLVEGATFKVTTPSGEVWTMALGKRTETPPALAFGVVDAKR